MATARQIIGYSNTTRNPEVISGRSVFDGQSNAETLNGVGIDAHLSAEALSFLDRRAAMAETIEGYLVENQSKNVAVLDQLITDENVEFNRLHKVRYPILGAIDRLKKPVAAVLAIGIAATASGVVVRDKFMSKTTSITEVVRPYDTPWTIAERAQNSVGVKWSADLGAEAARIKAEYGILHAGEIISVHVKK